jgi:hypothetical protein
MKFNKCRGVDDLKVWIGLNSASSLSTQSLCEQFEQMLIDFGDAYPGQPVTMRLGEYPDAPEGAYNAMKLIINNGDIQVEEIIVFKFANDGTIKEVLRLSKPGTPSTSATVN